MRRSSRFQFAVHAAPLVVLLAIAVVASACGSSITAVRVGNSTLDRDGVADLVAEVTGRPADGTIDAAATAGVINRFVHYEALVDLLAEYGVVSTPEGRSTARDRLIAAGLDDSLLGSVGIDQIAIGIADLIGQPPLRKEVRQGIGRGIIRQAKHGVINGGQRNIGL